MTELRKRMIECLQLRGLSARTQEMYVRAVRQRAEHYRKSPAVITEEERRQSFLYLEHVQHLARVRPPRSSRCAGGSPVRKEAHTSDSVTRPNPHRPS